MSRFWLLLHKVFKDDIKASYYLLPFVIFGLVFLGQMIAVIGSKQIVEPVKLSVIDARGDQVPYVKRFMQLARAGNYTLITSTNSNQDPWLVRGVFVKQFLIGIYESDLSKISRVDISLGEKTFSFTSSQVATWQKFNTESTSVIRSDLSDVTKAVYDVFIVPTDVTLGKSSIPIYKQFFGSIINWSGDVTLFGGAAYQALVETFLIIVLLVMLRVIYRSYFDEASHVEVNNHSRENGKEQIVFIMTIFVSLVILSFIVALVSKLYRPDVATLLKNAGDTYLNTFYKGFRPKPIERMQFIIGALFSPLIILVVYHLMKRWNGLMEYIYRAWYPYVAWKTLSVLFFWFYAGLALTGFYFILDSATFFGCGMYVFCIFLFPLCLWYFLKNRFSRNDDVLLFLRAVTILGFIITFFLNVMVLTPGFIPLTLDPMIYPVSQLFAGKSMLVNVNGLYGLFPFYLTPIFKVIGLSVFTFSVVMALFTVLSLYFVFRFMKLIIKDRIILYLGFLFVLFYTLLATRLTPEYYYQYWPVRYIFPTLSLFLSALYFKNPSKLLYYASFFIYGTAMLWNFDVGVIVFLTWMVMLSYQEIATFSSVSRFLLNLCKHGFFAAIGVMLAVGVFTAGTYIQSGMLPHMASFFLYQKMFLSGYFMIPLVSPPHIWSVVILVYLVGLFCVIRAMCDRTIGFDEKIIALLVSTGIGLFAYYEGQSSDVTLFRVWYPALILVVFFADKLFIRLRNEKNRTYAEYVVFSGLFLMLVSAPFNLLYNTPKYAAMIKKDVFTSYTTNNYYDTNIEFLKKETTRGERVLILGPLTQGIYYAETNTRSVIDVPGVPDIVFPKEMDTLIAFLNTNTKSKVFVQQPLEVYDVYDVRIRGILATRYQVVRSSGGTSGVSLYKARQ